MFAYITVVPPLRTCIFRDFSSRASV